MTLLNVNHYQLETTIKIENMILMSSNLSSKRCETSKNLMMGGDNLFRHCRFSRTITSYFIFVRDCNFILALLGPDPSNFFTQFYVFSQTHLVNHAVTKYVHRLPASPFTLKRLLLTTIRKQWRNFPIGQLKYRLYPNSNERLLFPQITTQIPLSLAYICTFCQVLISTAAFISYQGYSLLVEFVPTAWINWIYDRS